MAGRSKAALEFSKLGSPAVIAEKLGISQGMVSRIRNGSRLPGQEVRRKIAAEWDWVQPGDWDVPATTERAADTPRDPPPTESAHAVTLPGAAAALLEQANLLTDILRDATRELAESEEWTLKDKAAIANKLSPTIAAVSKLTGALAEPSEQYVSQLPAFRRIADRIAHAVAGCEKCSAAVLAALEGDGE